MNRTLTWLSEQGDPDFPTREKEHELRLESDENAVKIVTVHKSKGLEYPVFFCPFAWGGSATKKTGRNVGEFLFHDDRGQLTLGTINLCLMPENRSIPEVSRKDEDVSLACLYVSGKIEEGWRISSFSSMVLNKPHSVDLPDRDTLTALEKGITEERKTTQDIWVNRNWCGG